MLLKKLQPKFLTKDGEISGVKTHLDSIYHASKLIITTGTFLNGLIRSGTNKLEAGRVGG